MKLAARFGSSITPGSGEPHRTSRRLPARLLCGLAALAVCIPAMGGAAKDPLRFASEMARNGNWREARFRWERILAQDPDNARILNNLAVAREVLGDESEAGELYEKARSLAPGDPVIAENLARFRRFWKVERQEEDPSSSTAFSTTSHEPPKKAKNGKKTFRVEARLPVPARIDVSGINSLLVASFLTVESDLLDTSRELARYLRGEFRKRSALQVREVTPPPAIPEQRLEDLIANAEFWRHLGREHDSDLIVSGKVVYDRRDASGFQDVDYVSPSTGQKVRQTRFVEQEEFEYLMTILFFDGRTGQLVFRDQLKRSILFRGLNNDPITAFFELAETFAGDVLSVVSPRTRVESRVIFRG